MKDFFQTRGKLSVSVGEGTISSFEACSLKSGDVVSSSKPAGFPATAFYNEQFLCHCEVVIFTDVFGVRVTYMEQQDEGRTETGVKDEAIELLPFRIVLGAIQVSLEQIKGIGPGSFISLGKPYSEECDAVLEIAGLPAATGKVVCVYENVGLRLLEVYETSFGENNIRTTGNIYDKDYTTPYTKNYNFKRPDKFSRDAIDRLRSIHHVFANNLNRLYGNEAMSVTRIDQSTFAEALARWGNESNSFVILKNSRAVSPPTATNVPQKTLLLEEPGTNHPVCEESKELLKKMVPADGKVFGKPVFICYSHDDVAEEILSSAENLDSAVRCLRGAWKNLVDLFLEAQLQTAKASEIRIIHDNELVVAIELACNDQDAKCIQLIYPYITLEPFIRILN